MPLAALVSSAVLLSGCSVLEDWGVLPAVESVVEDIATPEEAAAPAAGEEGLAPEDTGFVIPTCDELFSTGQTGAMIEQERVNMGDTSEGDYGYGTTNPELVGLLKNVRTDLRISCTWYLPASESVSVTSLAVVNPDEASAVSAALASLGAAQQETGGGVLWSIDSTTSDESSDYIATEAHFLASVPCPSSLAETSCTAWVSTNYAFGQAETLTLDAAKNLEVFAG
ncbi:MAG: hypothetical protein F2621_04105 [Actinobacteria bacterium]|nr:hypothetical protein [Actinomycetota bacterium]MTA32888.1 hypothetical protein [Actinomycetota bacterium]